MKTATSIRPGDEAPDITLPSLGGESLRLSDLRGKPVWLAFYRYAACPLCNLRVRDVIRHHGELAERGLKVLAIFQSDTETMAEYVGKQDAPFPLLSDPEQGAYATYGVGASLAAYVHPRAGAKLVTAMRAGFMIGKMDGTKTRVPADFLIDADGVVVERYDGRDIGDHIPLEEVYTFVDAHGSASR